jgi:hypothetical protein
MEMTLKLGEGGVINRRRKTEALSSGKTNEIGREVEGGASEE